MGHTLGDVGGHATVHAGGAMAAFLAAGGIRGDSHDLAAGGHGSMAGGCVVLCAACVVGSGGRRAGVLVAGDALGLALALAGTAAGYAHALVAACNPSVGAV